MRTPIKVAFTSYMDGNHIYATLRGYEDGRIDVGRFNTHSEAEAAAIEAFQNLEAHRRKLADYDGLSYVGVDLTWYGRVISTTKESTRV